MKQSVFYPMDDLDNLEEDNDDTVFLAFVISTFLMHTISTSLSACSTTS